MRHVIAEAASAQTDTSLIAAPGAGNKTVIYGLYFSSDVQQKITVEHGSTALHAQYVPANGGSIAAFNARPGSGETILWEAPANTAVTYTSSVAGNVVVEAWYATHKA